MTTFSWAAATSGDWGIASNWSPPVVPNEPSNVPTPFTGVTAVDVSIDNPTTGPYFVTIGPTETFTVNSLTMNGANDLLGSNTAAYNASALNIDGKLVFGPGSAGAIGGSLQTYIFMNNGTMVNPGTIDGFIQGQGNVLLTGTNALYVTNYLQAEGGVVSVDTKSIAELAGNTLFDGIFEAAGLGGVINLGGIAQDMVVNIATIEGPPAIPNGWTELKLNGLTTEINEWNGAGFVPIESTLTEIAARGTFDILGGRNYGTSNTLTVTGPSALINLQANVVTSPLININGGTVQGAGFITGPVANNGVLRAEGGILTVGGSISGTGLIGFDLNQQAGTFTPGAAMGVFSVGAGQTFIMNGDDTLLVYAPAAFHGAIDAKVGDKIALAGVVANSAVVSGGNLVLEENGAPVYALALNAADAGATFVAAPFGAGSNTEVTLTALAPATPVASETLAADPTVSVTQGTTVGSFGVVDVTNGVSLTVPSTVLTGTLGAIVNDLATISPATLNVVSHPPSVFVSTGGVQSIDTSQANGSAVVAVAGGSATITGGAGDDTFAVNVAPSSGGGLSTILDFHSGDSLLLLGVGPSGSGVTTQDGAGLPGATGLELSYASNGVSSGAVLQGWSSADLASGALTESSGVIGGVSYLKVTAT